MGATHLYRLRIVWTGNLGAGTSGYRAYGRDHRIEAEGKAVIEASADPAFRGDAARYNPEELLLASLSSCHMLWYLHLSAAEGVVVTGYQDEPIATMIEDPGGGGRFTEAVLRPRVTLAGGSDRATAMALHGEAHRLCFIANSVSFPVRCEATIGSGSTR